MCYVVFPNHTHLLLIGWLDYNFNLHSLFHLNQNMYILFGLRDNHFPCSGTGVIGRDTCIGLLEDEY